LQEDPNISLKKILLKFFFNLNFNISENNIRSVQAAQVAGYCVQAYSIDERAVMEQSLSRKSSSSSNPKVGQYLLVCLLHRRRCCCCFFFFFFFFFPAFSSLLTDSVATKTS
jgi:hypothetical protein